MISVFVSATNVFMSSRPRKLRSAQAENYGPHIDYVQNTDAPLPEKRNENSHVLLFSTGRAVVYIVSSGTPSKKKYQKPS